jgi:uroporphyrinogen decarboxylase
VHLKVAENLTAAKRGPVFGGCIGPFSLAALLMGVNDALKATITDPSLVVSLLDNATAFIKDYLLAFREAGAAGVIMAEPTAGLLSPNALGKFSAPYVKRLVQAVQTEDFTLVYHNCGARNVHLSKILEAEAGVYHFGKLMDMASALQSTPPEVVLGGNMDPVAIFRYGTPQEVREITSELLGSVKPNKNFFISSGCDLPSGVPVENLDAFYDTVREFR